MKKEQSRAVSRVREPSLPCQAMLSASCNPKRSVSHCHTAFLKSVAPTVLLDTASEAPVSILIVPQALKAKREPSESAINTMSGVAAVPPEHSDKIRACRHSDETRNCN